LWDEDGKRLLFSREKIGTTLYLKFPGGGLEYGEGTQECVIREAMEELGISIRPTELFGITENFVPSLFKKGEQVIAVYYLATCPDFDRIQASSSHPIDNEYEGMIWHTPDTFDHIHLELASDQIILNRFTAMLKNRFA
jgi:8-oxo-dGTP diphosphatase